MAIRPRGIRRPPATSDPSLAIYLDEIRRAIEGLPFSVFSTPNGPNASSVTAPKGTLGIEVGSSVTVFWIKEGEASDAWSSVATIP